jgi:DNA sulfur modification protein DndD
MHLRSIALRDWKAYVQARFDFPAPTRNKNIILIGAENGYGKTSLFEAVVLGLFGRDGLPLIARAPFGGSDEDKLAVSYKDFIEGVLHIRALEEGRSSCTVQLTFDDDEGEPIEIKRTWSFNPNGAFNSPYTNEDVQIYEGTLRKPLGPPSGITGQDRLDWYRDYVAMKFLPSTLAAFFMFDGERVSEFADKDMQMQVRVGIEGLLGIPVLRGLANDLRSYAQSKRVGGKSDENLEKIEIEWEYTRKELDEKRARLAELEPIITKLQQQQARLTNELTGFGAGTQAQMQELVEQRAEHQRELERCEDKLRELVADDLSLAITGRELRQRTKERLRKEAVRDEWLSGKIQGNKGLDRFLTTFKDSAATIAPPLLETQLEGVSERIRTSWEALWYPPPSDCAEKVRHGYLQGGDRIRAQEHLEQIDKMGSTQILQLLDNISSRRSQLDRVQGELSRTQGIGPELDAKRTSLREINEELNKKNREAGALKDAETALSATVDKFNKDIARLTARMDQRQPENRRAAMALKVAAMIDELVTEAVPGQIDAVAVAMTSAHKHMAHKRDLVKSIEIDSECNLSLLSQKNRNLRDLDLSAGEKQIFTQSLISAIASVSGRAFPLMIDTPLGRLDREHRSGVLSHLAARNGQVILLSTNTEVVDESLEVIRSHVLKSFRIRHEQNGDVGRSWVSEGYFEG